MRRTTLTMLLPALLLAAPASAEHRVQCPPEHMTDPTVKCLHLGAGDGFLKMADGPDRVLYSFGFSAQPLEPMPGMPGMEMNMDFPAEAPGPTIILDEGDRLYLTLSNIGMLARPDLFDPHSVHWHGFPQAAPVYDGIPEASITINMGGSFTYFYKANDPGTYMYHCHVEATEHMQMGMLAQLWVHPRQDRDVALFPKPDGTLWKGFAYNDGDGSTGYDLEFGLQLSGMDRAFHEQHLAVQPLPFAYMKDTYHLINGRGYPDTVIDDPAVQQATLPTQPIHALVRIPQGKVALLRLSSLSVTRYYTVTIDGIPMRQVGKGARLLPRGPDGLPGKPVLTVTLGGGETADILLDTTGIPKGTYLFHATDADALVNDAQANGGMQTEIRVE